MQFWIKLRDNGFTALLFLPWLKDYAPVYLYS
jgi:hypothetical protein